LSARLGLARFVLPLGLLTFWTWLHFSILTQIFIHSPVENLGLQEGKEAYAVIKASNVMIALDD